MKCYLCGGYHLVGEDCNSSSLRNNYLDNNPYSPLPKYEPPEINYDLDPVLPKYEPPSYDLPKYDPPTLDPVFPEKDYLAPPPPSPVRDIENNLIGYKDSLSNQIYPSNNMINNGMPLRVEGNFVRDTMGNLVGQMGPGNTMFPPPGFGPPKLG